MDEGIGERFLRETRHSRSHLVGGRTDWARQPSWFKTYPEAPRVALPPLTSGAGAPADGAVRKAKPICRAVTPAAAHSSPPSSSRPSGGGPYSRTLRRRASTSNNPAAEAASAPDVRGGSATLGASG